MRLLTCGVIGRQVRVRVYYALTSRGDTYNHAECFACRYDENKQFFRVQKRVPLCEFSLDRESLFCRALGQRSSNKPPPIAQTFCFRRVELGVECFRRLELSVDGSARAVLGEFVAYRASVLVTRFCPVRVRSTVVVAVEIVFGKIYGEDEVYLVFTVVIASRTRNTQHRDPEVAPVSRVVSIICRRKRLINPGLS